MHIADVRIQGSLAEHATSAQAEADRLMTVCNACRYCEGLCAVFPAMEMRRSFTDGDLNYIANLCHGCGACYDDCQFSPPHEFHVNIPRTLGIVRSESYEAYAWPGFLSGLFRRNGLAISLITALSVAAFITGFIALNEPGALFATSAGPGSFYKLMPHNSMAALFGAAFLYAAIALAMGVRNLWTSIDGAKIDLDIAVLWQAMMDAGCLRYLDGGGSGCVTDSAKPKDRRKFYHHMAFYGFALCFAATSVATLYHYLLGLPAPYPWYDLPVLLGTVGGIGLLIGPAGLLAEKWRRDPALQDEARFGMETAFLAMLFLTSLTGLALLVLRDTAAMGLLLALHLGVVFALFITMPYGKFVHGIYRFTTLVRYAAESRALNDNTN